RMEVIAGLLPDHAFEHRIGEVEGSHRVIVDEETDVDARGGVPGPGRRGAAGDLVPDGLEELVVAWAVAERLEVHLPPRRVDEDDVFLAFDEDDDLPRPTDPCRPKCRPRLASPGLVQEGA